jgi:protein-L-isoaspartate(D-aspartate) O-methyltransferase
MLSSALVFVLLLQTGDASRAQRLRMVEEQIEARGVKNPRVLDAMRRVRRERFVPEDVAHLAYRDSALPIGHAQTISQPYIVAYMTEALDPQPHHRVLEIGTGSGYQAAVLSGLVKDVYTIEIVAALAMRARQTLESLGYANVHVREGDGYQGWAEHAPFDRIIVTAAPPRIPQPLIDQLATGGIMVIPVGERDSMQWMTIVEKKATGIVERRTIPVAFVPFTRKPGDEPTWRD